MRTQAFLNALLQYDPQPGGTQKHASASGVQQLVNQPSGSSQNPQTTSTDPFSLERKWKAVYALDTLGQTLEVVGLPRLIQTQRLLDTFASWELLCVPGRD